MVIELNELEKKILTEVKNGKTEFLFKKDGHEDFSKEEFEAPWLLKQFEYLNLETFSNEKEVGYINVSLTDKGEYYFMSEEEVKELISQQVKQLFNK